MAQVSEIVFKVELDDELRKLFDEVTGAIDELTKTQYSLRHEIIVLRDAHNHLVQRVEELQKGDGSLSRKPYQPPAAG